jgi:hypothetical protein
MYYNYKSPYYFNNGQWNWVILQQKVWRSGHRIRLGNRRSEFESSSTEKSN